MLRNLIKPSVERNKKLKGDAEEAFLDEFFKDSFINDYFNDEGRNVFYVFYDKDGNLSKDKVFFLKKEKNRIIIYEVDKNGGQGVSFIQRAMLEAADGRDSSSYNNLTEALYIHLFKFLIRRTGFFASKQANFAINTIDYEKVFPDKAYITGSVIGKKEKEDKIKKSIINNNTGKKIYFTYEKLLQEYQEKVIDGKTNKKTIEQFLNVFKKTQENNCILKTGFLGSAIQRYLIQKTNNKNVLQTYAEEYAKNCGNGKKNKWDWSKVFIKFLPLDEFLDIWDFFEKFSKETVSSEDIKKIQNIYFMDKKNNPFRNILKGDMDIYRYTIPYSYKKNSICVQNVQNNNAVFKYPFADSFYVDKSKPLLKPLFSDMETIYGEYGEVLLARLLLSEYTANEVQTEGTVFVFDKKTDGASLVLERFDIYDEKTDRVKPHFVFFSVRTKDAAEIKSYRRILGLYDKKLLEPFISAKKESGKKGGRNNNLKNYYDHLKEVYYDLISVSEKANGKKIESFFWDLVKNGRDIVLRIIKVGAKIPLTDKNMEEVHEALSYLHSAKFYVKSLRKGETDMKDKIKKEYGRKIKNIKEYLNNPGEEKAKNLTVDEVSYLIGLLIRELYRRKKTATYITMGVLLPSINKSTILKAALNEINTLFRSYGHDLPFNHYLTLAANAVLALRSVRNPKERLDSVSLLEGATAVYDDVAYIFDFENKKKSDKGE